MNGNVFDYVPLTFVVDLDSETGRSNYNKFIACYNYLNSLSENTEFNYNKINEELQSIITLTGRKNFNKVKLGKTQFMGKNIWILKPTGLNRGRGVSVFNSLDKFKSLIKEYSEGNPKEGNGKNQTIKLSDSGGISNLNNLPFVIKTRSFVIQKYIEQPLLIYNRKFDVRCWALVADDMKLYFFKEGYIRTSSSEYTMDQNSINKKEVHLTNNAVQKYCSDYGKFEDGNQLSFSMFQVFLIDI